MSDDLPEPTLPITGGCGCGAVRFELSEKPVAAAYCHCTICQHRTGTGFQATALAAHGSFTLLRGEEHVGRWAPTSGSVKCFCRECGSHTFSISPSDDQVVFVRMAAFDEDPGVRPAARQFVAYAAAWEPIPDDGLPRFPEAISAPPEA